MEQSQVSNLRRLLNEVKQIKNCVSEYHNMFELSMVGDDMYHWKTIINGPEDSLYHGYKFEVDIQLPVNYPFAPPKVKFITPIQHVNVNSTGDVCLDILKNNWAPSQNIHSVILSLRLLLSNPCIDDPFNHDLAQLFIINQDDYIKKIIKYCNDKAKQI